MITIYLVDLFKLALVGVHLLADWHCTKRILELHMSYERMEEIEFEGLEDAQQVNIQSLAEAVIEEEKRKQVNEVAANPVYSSIEGTEMVPFFNELYEEVNGSVESSDYIPFSDEDVPTDLEEPSYDLADELLTMDDYVAPTEREQRQGLQRLDGRVIGMQDDYIHLAIGQSREWIKVGENVQKIKYDDYLSLEIMRDEHGKCHLASINKLDYEISDDYVIPDEKLA